MGNCFEPLDQNVARIAAVKCGLPLETPGFTIVVNCASGMQAMICGTQAIRDGDVEVVIAGGVESMSTAPYILTTTRWGQRLQHGQLIDMLWRAMQEYPIGAGMGLTAENLAEKYGISREEQDQFSLLSQQRACKAIQEGKFKDEITPVSIPQKKGEAKIVDTDEHPRPDVTLEKLAKLPPAFKKDGTVTAGNSSGLNDAAAVTVLMSKEKAKEMGLKPLAKILGYAIVGVDPILYGYRTCSCHPEGIKQGRSFPQGYPAHRNQRGFCRSVFILRERVRIKSGYCQCQWKWHCLGSPCRGNRMPSGRDAHS